MHRLASLVGVGDRLQRLRARREDKVKASIGHLAGNGVGRRHFSLRVEESDASRLALAVAVDAQTIDHAAHALIQDRLGHMLENADPCKGRSLPAPHVRRQ
jgi:hypothetical protein